MRGDTEYVALWLQDQPAEVNVLVHVIYKKAGRSYPVPEDNGDPVSVDPAAAELIHKRKVPSRAGTPCCGAFLPTILKLYP